MNHFRVRMSTGIGEALRSAREEQGRELQDAARVLRVRTDYLVALEEERFDAFGGDVYAKGFLRSYAGELGLDPEPLLDIYRREISESEISPSALLTNGAATAPASGRRSPPAWLAWVVVIAVILGGLGLLGVLGDTAPDRASPDDVGETPPTADDGRGDGDGEPELNGSPDDEPVPDDGGEATDDREEPEPEIEGVELMLAFEEASWVRVVVDGTPLVQETVESGETRQFEGESEVEVRFGNAGGVRVEYNGEDLGSPGARGEVVDVTFGADDVEGMEE